ncbi:MAG: peptidoglycan-associated lipoprotein Pal [Gammaproteobacteria bacterium]|nr:peptidoglycan-associated lipoprotein Pal [Gammaproteobacteria bacterium]MDH5650897.1 peptidoglycan-associated lipoprotein Pal [Gammaproteobacteria bacterium]
MRRLVNLLIIFGLIFALTGCGSTTKKDDEGTSVAATEGGAEGEIKLDGESTEGGATGEVSIPEKRVIYFEFDSSNIQSDFQEVITAHAAYLAAHPDTTIVLEGHADERGTREYNIALGERRARAVQQLLTLQGVVEKQIQVISFGEERPVAMGHDESAWSLNRRVEILYSGQ